MRKRKIFVAVEELPLPFPKTFTNSTPSLHVTRNAWGFQPLPSSRTVCRSHQQQQSSSARQLTVGTPRSAPNTPAIPLRPSPGLLSIHVPRPLPVTFSAIYCSVWCHHPTLWSRFLTGSLNKLKITKWFSLGILNAPLYETENCHVKIRAWV